MAISESRKKAYNKYISKAYGSIAIRWPKDFCESVRSAADKSGESIAGYVRRAIEARMREDEKNGGEG